MREKLRSVPAQQRTKIRTTASAFGVSMSVVQWLLANGGVKRRATIIDPVISAENKLQWISYALSFIDDKWQQCDGHEGHPMSPMYPMTYVDKKWFHHNSKTRSYYLLPDVEPPKHSLRRAHFIQKTMFLYAAARPISLSLAICCRNKIPVKLHSDILSYTLFLQCDI